MKDLIVAWQEPNTRKWLPVGRLSLRQGVYSFVYTKGAKDSKVFEPFGMMTKLDNAYFSRDIFPMFANRILAKSRPEYSDYIRWLGLTPNEYSELEVLSRSGGVRATDTLEIFPCPSQDENGKFIGYFFSHGLRYLTSENQTRISQLKRGERLFLMNDIQNMHDSAALLMRTSDPMSLVGYCPRYLSAEYSELIRLSGQDQVQISVEKINLDAPTEMRLLCKIVATWPKDYSPCSSGLYEPLIDISELTNLYELV